MNTLLKNNNYIFLPNFIDKNRAKLLSEEFKRYCVDNDLGGDSQSPNSHSKYNFISFLELLCEKTPEVSDILGETVVPTYSYARVYKNGSVLEKHIDRESCEISLTVHLFGDSEWPIFIETPSGESKSISMSPGDAMIYLGCTSPHWRNKFQGEEYVQVFLHYVRSRGKNSLSYFDRFPNESKNEYHNIKNISDNSEFVDYDKFKSEKKSYSYNLTTNSEKIISSSDKSLKEYIHIIDNLFSSELCDNIIEEYQHCNDWKDAQIADNTTPLNTDIRNCKIINLSENNNININYNIRKNLDEFIFESISRAVLKYTEVHPDFFINIDTGYDLLRYDEGCFYKQHTDSFKEQQRSISCSVQLNDNYEGGEFCFFDRELKFKLSKGSAILFPSNFMFPHEIMPVTKGSRYSIITWLV